MRQSHVTYYFPTRHDLVEALAVRFADGIAFGVQDMAGKPGTAKAALQHVAEAIADQGRMRMFTGLIVEADRDPALRAILVRVTLRLQATLAELLGGRNAARRAEVVLASLWGLGLYDFVVRPKRRSAPPGWLLAPRSE